MKPKPRVGHFVHSVLLDPLVAIGTFVIIGTIYYCCQNLPKQDPKTIAL